MHRKKTIACLILSILLLCSTGESFLFQEAAAAESDCRVEVKNAAAKAGEPVEVDVVVQNNPGILGATFKVTYDSGLTLIAARNGEAFSALSMTKPGVFKSGCNFVWDGQEILPEDVHDGTILTLTFTVSEAAVAGDSFSVGISCIPGAVVDSGLDPVRILTSAGAVTVPSPVGEIVAIGTKADGTLTATIRSTTVRSGVTLIFASYADSGKMLGCAVRAVDLAVGDNPFSYKDAFGGSDHKAFLLDEQQEPLCPEILFARQQYHTVRFVDHDGMLLSEQSIAHGENAVPPQDPEREGYIFTGWSGDYTLVTSNRTITAQYQKESAEPVLTVSSVSASAGEKEVAVAVSVKNNPGILGMTLSVSYDEKALTLKRASNGGAFQGVLTMTAPGRYKSGCNFVWDGQEISDEDIKDGVILTLYFDVADTAASGAHTVEISYQKGAIIDKALDAITLSMNNGGVVIE